MTPLVDDSLNGLYGKAEDGNDLETHKTKHKTPLNMEESGGEQPHYHGLIIFQLYYHQFILT